MKKLNNESQFKVRIKAKKEIERLMQIYNNEEKQKMIDNFKSKFSICEIIYKIILDTYLFNKNGKHDDRMKIDMRNVNTALKYIGYDFDKDFLHKLFGSKTTMGQRSVKKLRDSLTHSAKNSDINELTVRYAELDNYMSTFLDKIYTFDNNQK